jgi:hypothetical protein
LSEILIFKMNWRKILLVVSAVPAFLAIVSADTGVAESAGSAKYSASNYFYGGYSYGEKCAVPPLKQALLAASSVFTGKVLSMTQVERGKTFEFEVEKYWKGTGSKKLKVTVYESSRFQAFYRQDGKYLVFARIDEDAGLIDGRCSRSKDIADAADDIRSLGKAKVPK